MKKFLIYLSSLLLLVGASVTSAWAKDKTLCDLLSRFEYATFEVKYDQRLVDPDEITYQNPDGGIKLELLFFVDTLEARENLIKSIDEVVYFHKSTGTQYIIKKPEKFVFLGNIGFEYNLYIADKNYSLGDWEVIAREKHNYKAYFTLTEEMFEQVAPIPVDPSVSENADGDYVVTCSATNAEGYSVRLIDIIDDFEFVIPWDELMECNGGTGTCVGVVPYEYGDLRPRIEAKFYNLLWPKIMEGGNPDSCNPYGMITGQGWARTSTWFTFPD